MIMMQLDRMTLGRMAKEMGFVRDTFEKVCRLADVLKYMVANMQCFIVQSERRGRLKNLN